MVCSFGFRDDSKTGRNQLMCSLKQLYCYLWFPDHKKNGLPLTEQLGGGAACMHLELSGQLQLRKHLCAQGASLLQSDYPHPVLRTWLSPGTENLLMNAWIYMSMKKKISSEPTLLAYLISVMILFWNFSVKNSSYTHGTEYIIITSEYC